MKILKVKRILFSLLAMLGVAVFMTSCEQEAIQVENLSDFQSSEVLFAKHDYLPDEIPDFQNNPPLKSKSIFKEITTLEKMISIGYKKDVPVYKDNTASTRDQILNFMVTELQKKKSGANVSLSDIKPRYFKYIDAVMIEVDDYEILGKLRRLKTIRYVEPESLDIDTFLLPDNNEKSGSNHEKSGCGGAGIVSDDKISRRFSHNNNSRIPWQYDANNVYGAWNHSNKGKGVAVALIDTGISADQDLLDQNQLFATGESSGRTIIKRTEFSTSPNDNCGHGTTMAGQIAGPLNNQGGLIGAAYKADLISYRVADGVLLNMAWERVNVVDAVEDIVQRKEAKIIALAMGRIQHSGILDDAAVLANENGILMICAAGSGGSGALNPAKHYSTIAVTVVKYGNSAVNLESFGGNATGSFVDFCVYMKRDGSGDERFGGGMRMNDNNLRNAKGSSSGVATVAGIAAMILSNGSWHDKWLIIDRMKWSASIFTQENRKDSDFGWGVIDAEAAVRRANGWLFDCDITGPEVVTALNTTIDYDYSSNNQTSKTWFVRNRDNDFTWTNQNYGMIKFNSYGTFEICCTNSEDCTDCVNVRVEDDSDECANVTCPYNYECVGGTCIPW